MVHTRFPNSNGCRDRNRAAVAVTTSIMRILSRVLKKQGSMK
jgi:hypothetical protein